MTERMARPVLAERSIAEMWPGDHPAEAPAGNWVVVDEPVVGGHALDSIVLAPQGIFVLHVRAWEGELRPARYGTWRSKTAEGRSLRYPNPIIAARTAEQALRRVLRAKLAGLHPAIHHLLVLTDPGAKALPAVRTRLTVVHADAVAETIVAFPLARRAPLQNGEIRLLLGQALNEGAPTGSQRAPAPFVFRSGGLMGSGRKVWTLQAMVRHMDRFPEDAAFHLENGTLAQWLDEQRAHRLAALARDIMRRRDANPRRAVETFLQSTGMVRRPRLSVAPVRLSLGPVVSGEPCTGRLQVRKGRGRGYLYGALRTSEPWLSVEPDSFAMGPQQVLVTADSETLPIGRRPQRAHILIESNATVDPVLVPVRLKVVGIPSWLGRHVLRPLAGALLAALLGAVAGWGLGHSGLEAPPWLARTPALRSLPPSMVWALAVGLIWALLGAFRGLKQPAAWTVDYAAVRSLLSTAAMGAGLALLALAYQLFRPLIAPVASPAAQVLPVETIVLGAVSLAALPVTLLETLAWRLPKTQRERPAPQPQRVRRRRAPAGVMIALCLLVLLGATQVGWVRQPGNVGAAAAEARQWTTDQWALVKRTAHGLVDQFLYRPLNGEWANLTRGIRVWWDRIFPQRLSLWAPPHAAYLSRPPAPLPPPRGSPSPAHWGRSRSGEPATRPNEQEPGLTESSRPMAEAQAPAARRGPSETSAP